MVDVSRQSTFPPLLGRYSCQIPSKTDSTPKYLRASTRMRSLLDQQQSERRMKSHKPRTKRPVKTERTRPLTVSVESISKRLEGETRRRKHEKAEGTLKAWDALLKQDKDQKHQLLQQRVKIQRELIDKNDQLCTDLRTRAEEDRLERIQSVRKTKRDIMSGLQAHLQRVEEHKRKISRKMQEIQAGRQESRTPLLGHDQIVTIRPDTLTVRETSEDGESSPVSSEKIHATTLQPLGSDCSQSTSIEAKWEELKADSIRRINPVVRYSNQLKHVASPSVRQCLEVYEKPTTRDRFTGKPVPLSDVLGEMSSTRVNKTSTRNNAIELMTRNTQKIAEIMLENKQSFTTSMTGDPTFYLPEHNSPAHPPTLKSTTASKSLTTPVSKRYPTSHKMKKQLPSYLTKDGDLVSGSLEEIGDQFYCTPSRTKRVGREVYGHAEDSVFLTDLQGSPLNSAGPSNSHLLHTDNRTSVRHYNRWQPLSTSALTEHSKVTAVPVVGLGHLAHGQYRMWRPDTCVVGESDSTLEV